MNEGFIELRDLDITQPESIVEDEIKSTKNTYLSSDQLQLILLRLGFINDDELNLGVDKNINIPKEAEFIVNKIQELNIEEALTILRNALAEHKDDINFLHEDYHLLERLVRLAPSDGFHNIESEEEKKFKNKEYLHIYDRDIQCKLEAALIAYHSPYPEIRAITDPFDDPSIPVETFRVYVISLFWTIIGSIINNFFIHRLPSITLNAHTVQILIMPSGKLWEKYVPDKKVKIFGIQFYLNKGPWTYKELMLSTIIYLCSSGTPYLIYNIFVMKLKQFYGLTWVTWPYQIFLTLSTQYLGFAFALLMKRVCIYPSKALWPTILPTIALNRALMNLETNTSVYGWKISRYSFFCVTLLISFFYNWFPSYFIKILSNFNWITWFNPNLIHLTNITGSNFGLGLNPIPTFDWNIIDMAGCLTIPFYTYANQYIGTLIGFFLITMTYYFNVKWTAYFPINSNRLFNNKGEVFKVNDILNSENQFDKSKYEEVGPPYFSAANLIIYGGYFCLYPFSILYHFITEWDSMKTSLANVYYSLKDSFSRESKRDIYGRYRDDPHCKMMAKYEDVPDWWFLTILITSICLGIICVTLYPSETPVWGIFFTILINFLFLIPLTSIASVTGFSFGLNVLVELIVGYAIPNSGIALITLKSFGYNIDSQASNYITDQKIAHYSKIPPRAIFRGQLISTFLSVIVALLIANWQMENVKDICTPQQKEKLSCPGVNTYFYSSVQYGEIGPAKVFGGIYPALKWCFLGGALLVLPCIWIKKRAPINIARYFQPTIIIGGILLYAPYNLLYFTCGLYVSYFFMYYVKHNYLNWWEKYNYILTSGLSAGVAFSALIIFFTVQYNDHELHWWGNSLNEQGIEGGMGQKSWLNAKDAEGGYVGIRKGNFP